MSTFIDINTFPFTRDQIRAFRRELENMGDFDSLMRAKEALKTKEGCTFICLYDNVAEYKEKYLCGVYEPLREHYSTQVPYTFWGKLYQILKKVNPKIQ